MSSFRKGHAAWVMNPILSLSLLMSPNTPALPAQHVGAARPQGVVEVWLSPNSPRPSNPCKPPDVQQGGWCACAHALLIHERSLTCTLSARSRRGAVARTNKQQQPQQQQPQQPPPPPPPQQQQQHNTKNNSIFPLPSTEVSRDKTSSETPPAVTSLGHERTWCGIPLKSGTGQRVEFLSETLNCCHVR